MASSNDATRAGKISRFQIFQAKDGGESVDISAAVLELRYYENVLSNTISLTANIAEVGLIEKKISKDVDYPTGILDILPIRGGEPVILEIQDNNNTPNKLKFSGDNKIYVNRVRGISPDTQKDLYTIDFCSKEFISNEQARVIKRYDGKISDNVGQIIRRDLKSNKTIRTDETLVPYNFIGNYRKPLYLCTWLASKSIPSLSVNGKSSEGGTAGYLFYENYDGFNFRSIDKLFEGEATKKYIYTNTPDQVEGYDAKVLEYDIERNIDLQKNLTLGTYANWSVFFDFYENKYKFKKFNVDDYQKDKVFNAGKDDLRYIAEEFRTSPSRLMSHILDYGSLPSGSTGKKQLENWKNDPINPNYDAENTMVQSIMRYNQMFTIKVNIIIPGDFSLRAGQLVHFDFKQLNKNGELIINKQSSGIYMIASLCHRITPIDTYTSLSLVRDTFGRKPFK